MAEDLLSMLCADGIVVATSTLNNLFSHHSRASRIYFPYTCAGKMRNMNVRPGTQVCLVREGIGGVSLLF